MSNLTTPFLEIETKYRAQIIYDTWGHLEPQPGDYPGWIVFAKGVFDSVIVDYGFEVNDCPGFYDDLHDFVYEKTETQQCDERGVYRFSGLYRRHKNGRGHFYGTIEVIHKTPQIAD